MKDEAPELVTRAIAEHGMSALGDVLGQLEPVTGPDEVTRVHYPPQDRCDDLACPCGLPPPGAVPVTVTDPGGPRAAVADWASGRTTALICWRGWDGAARPGDPSGILTWKRTVTDERDVAEGYRAAGPLGAGMEGAVYKLDGVMPVLEAFTAVPGAPQLRALPVLDEYAAPWAGRGR